MKKILIDLYLAYIKFFAKIKLKIVNPTIIGVGGSSGKSSLARLVEVVLSQKYNVHSTSGKNSETGIPLDILGIKISNYSYLFFIKSALLAPFKVFINNNKFEFYVVEMGIDRPKPPKNMKYLLGIVSPNIGVLTNILIEHSVFFDEKQDEQNEKTRKKDILDAIAKEESLLLTTLDEKSKAIVNLDDARIKDLNLKSDILKVSNSDKNADFKIEKIEIGINSFKLLFIFLKEKYEVNLNRPLPDYYSTTIVLAIATCFSAGISVKDAIEIIQKKFSVPPGRFSVFEGIKNTTLIDSSYNSSLEAAIGTIEVLKKIGKNKRKVGILGDMRELGSLSKIQHETLSNEIIKNLNFVILIGPQMKEYVVPMLDKSDFEYLWFGNFSDAKKNITKNIISGDLVLVKGSQNELYLERVVEMLLKRKEDRIFLPRRGKFWENVRNKSK